MPTYELLVFQMMRGAWIPLIEFDDALPFGELMNIINLIGKFRLNFRIIERGGDKRFQHELYLTDASGVEDDDCKASSKKYLFPREDQVKKRAFKIYEQTGCDDADANYYQALKELQLILRHKI